MSGCEGHKFNRSGYRGNTKAGKGYSHEICGCV